ESTPRAKSRIHHARHLLYYAYRRFDESRSVEGPDAFQCSNIEELLEGCTTLRVSFDRNGKFSDATHAKLSSYQLDVALCFGVWNLNGPLLRIAKYGVWRHRHGDALVNDADSAGMWEIVERTPVTSSALEIRQATKDLGAIIYLSFAATSRSSLKASRNSYFWKSTGFAIRKLRDLYDEGTAALAPVSLEAAGMRYRQRREDAPTNLRMARFLSASGLRSIGRRVERTFLFDPWILGYHMERGRSSPADVDHHFHKMFPPIDRFWADPFPIKKGDRYYIFIEEYPYKDGKGFLSVIEMEESGNWTAPQPILKAPNHLSYPFVFEWRGEYYMTPESSESGQVVLYRSRSFPFDWQLESVLLSDSQAVDPTLHWIENRWWMFVNIAVEGARFTDELHLFYADRPHGPWTPHPRNPVKSDVRSARPAGRLFEHDRVLYRPAQDSSVQPGHAISLNIVERISTTEYVERETSKILPRRGKRITSIHTLNHVEGLTLIDCRYRMWKRGYRVE
ncbi:MAG: glucosamine inositolphosphorylceramide transferase family protein, partial [Vicinamibacteria bacterium]